MTAIERIRAALNAASCGPWIGAGPSFGRPLPEYLDSVVQDCGDGDCSITICRDTETSDASYIAACNPSAMSEVLAHIDALEAENERLKNDYQRACKLVADMHAAAVGEITGPKVGVVEDVAAVRTENERLRAESEERLQNCAALVAEVERLRAEVTRPESTDMTLMRALVQSQATELERLRKDAERLDYIEESGNFGVFRYRSGSKGPVLIEAEDGKKDINKSASTLRDAIDAVMKDAK